jgi:hypothetical protein
MQKAQTMICHSHDSGGLTTEGGGQFAMIGSTVLLTSSIRVALAPHEPAAPDSQARQSPAARGSPARPAVRTSLPLRPATGFEVGGRPYEDGHILLIHLAGASGRQPREDPTSYV